MPCVALGLFAQVGSLALVDPLIGAEGAASQYGRELAARRVRHADLTKGGELAFEMGK